MPQDIKRPHISVFSYGLKTRKQGLSVWNVVRQYIALIHLIHQHLAQTVPWLN